MWMKSGNGKIVMVIFMVWKQLMNNGKHFKYSKYSWYTEIRIMSMATFELFCKTKLMTNMLFYTGHENIVHSIFS